MTKETKEAREAGDATQPIEQPRRTLTPGERQWDIFLWQQRVALQLSTAIVNGALELALKYIDSCVALFDAETVTEIIENPEVQEAARKAIGKWLHNTDAESVSLVKRLEHAFRIQLSVQEKQAAIEDYLCQFYLGEGYFNIAFIDWLETQWGISLPPEYFAQEHIQKIVRAGLIKRIEEKVNLFDPRTFERRRDDLDIIGDNLILRFALSQETLKAAGTAFLKKITSDLNGISIKDFVPKVRKKFGLSEEEIKSVGIHCLLEKARRGTIFKYGALHPESAEPIAEIVEAYQISEEELKEIVCQGSLKAIGKYIVLKDDFVQFQDNLRQYGIEPGPVIASEEFFYAVVDHVIGAIALNDHAKEGEPFGYEALVEYGISRPDDDQIKAIFRAIERRFGSGQQANELMIQRLKEKEAEAWQIEQFLKNLDILKRMQK